MCTYKLIVVPSSSWCFFSDWIFFSNNVPFESVKVKNEAKHFKIYHSENKFYVEESCCFSSLLDLVQHYQCHPLASLYRLGKPCVRVRQTELSISQFCFVFLSFFKRSFPFCWPSYYIIFCLVFCCLQIEKNWGCGCSSSCHEKQYSNRANT